MKIAQEHKKLDRNLENHLDYQCSTIEDFNKLGNEGKFDIVTSFEVIEHINNPEFFIQELSKALKPDGLLFLSTMEKNMQAYFFTVFMAENVLRMVDKGTHDYEKFINFKDLERMANNSGLETISHQTAFYDPVSNTFFYSPMINAHYLACFRKLSN